MSYSLNVSSSYTSVTYGLQIVNCLWDSYILSGPERLARGFHDLNSTSPSCGNFCLQKKSTIIDQKGTITGQAPKLWSISVTSRNMLDMIQNTDPNAFGRLRSSYQYVCSPWKVTQQESLFRWSFFEHTLAILSQFWEVSTKVLYFNVSCVGHLVFSLLTYLIGQFKERGPGNKKANRYKSVNRIWV